MAHVLTCDLETAYFLRKVCKKKMLNAQELNGTQWEKEMHLHYRIKSEPHTLFKKRLTFLTPYRKQRKTELAV